MERNRRPLSVAALTASLLTASLILPGTAFAAPGGGQGGSGGSGSPSIESTGVKAGDEAPSGDVMVLLKDQIGSQPATQRSVSQRRDTAKTQQEDVLRAAGVSVDGVKHFTLVNSFAAHVTPEQAAALAKDPRVKSIVADVAVESPVAPEAKQAAAEANDLRKAQGKGSTSAQTKGRDKTKGKGKGKDQRPQDAKKSFDLCPADPQKPLLEPEALEEIKAASPSGAESAQSHATGKGVKVAVMAEGIDPNAPDYRRPDGTSAIVDYKNFSGAPDSALHYGGEIFGDASSVVAQGLVVHDLSTWVHPSQPLPSGCNIKVKGVAPDASLVALTILGGGTGEDDHQSMAMASNVAQAIDYAVTVQHVDVISESIGAEAIPDQSSRNAVQQFNDAAVDMGVTVIASSGDAGVSGTMGNPAIDPKVIAAAATTTNRSYQQIGFTGTVLSNGKWANKNVASFSSGGFGQSGNLPVLAAPGDSGWAACTDKTDRPGCTDMQGRPSSLEIFGGTSQSAPFIGGVAALIIEAYKEGHGGKAPTPAVVRQILTGTATDIGAPGTHAGAGQVDALAAVKLAKTFGIGTGKAAKALVTDRDQLQVSGEAGSSVSSTVTVRNNSNKKVEIAPALKRLVPLSQPKQQSVKMAADGPTLVNQAGGKSTYTIAKFTVPEGADHYTFRFAYGPKSGETAPTRTASVNLSLIDPDGAYVGNTRPQSGTSSTGPSNYGRMDIGRPKPGVWRAVFATQPSVRDNLGADPEPVPAYAGPIDYTATMNVWKQAGTVSQKKLSIKGNSTAAFTVKSILPDASGDSTTSVFLGAPKDFTAPVIPVSQRVLVGLDSQGGTFSGTMTGGNGRSGAPASQDSYSMDVPSGKKSMQIKVGFPTGYEVQGLRLGLVDPNGVLQSVQPNVTFEGSGSGALLSVADPIPGRWTVVVIQVVSTLGRQVSTPYTGTVTFDRSGVSSTELSKLAPGAGAPQTLEKGMEHTATIRIKNNADVEQSYVVDPRTAEVQSITYPALSAQMPTPPLEILGGYRLPPQVSRIDVKAEAPVAVQAQIAGPTALLALAGMTAVGPAAHPSGGQATSTATLSVPSGQLTPGLYTPTAGSVGPFGDAGAPKATAKLTTTVYAPGFDSSVSTDAGDLFADELTGRNPAVPIVVPAHGTASVAVRIDPRGEPGQSVSGRVNVVTLGNMGLLTLLSPYVLSTDQLVESFDYRYVVGAPRPQFTGTVTGVGGSPLEGVRVTAFGPGGEQVQHQVTGKAGTYGLGGLKAGSDYRVCFDASRSPEPGYLGQCYDGVTWVQGSPVPAGATALTAPAAGEPKGGVDAQLRLSSSIRGVVTDEAGKPVPGIIMVRSGEDGNLDLGQMQITDAQGAYEFSGLEKDAVVCALTSFLPASDEAPTGLVSSCDGIPWGLDTKYSPAPGAKPVKVVQGKAVEHNVVLAAGAKLSGTVKLKESGAPVPAASVVAVSKDARLFGTVVNVSDKAGRYEVVGVPAQAVGVCAGLANSPDLTCADSVGYAGPPQPLPTGARTLTAQKGQTVDGIDIALLSGSNAATGTRASALASFVKEVLKQRAR